MKGPSVDLKRRCGRLKPIPTVRRHILLTAGGAAKSWGPPSLSIGERHTGAARPSAAPSLRMGQLHRQSARYLTRRAGGAVDGQSSSGPVPKQRYAPCCRAHTAVRPSSAVSAAWGALSQDRATPSSRAAWATAWATASATVLSSTEGMMQPALS